MTTLASYIRQFAHLRRAPNAVFIVARKRQAPHKPILLLAVLDLVARGVIISLGTCVSWRQMKRLLLTIMISALPLLFSAHAFATNGYQETAVMWQKLVTQDAEQYSLFLQNFYAEVEAQVGPDKNALIREVGKRLAEKYPGSSYVGLYGTFAANNYTHLTFDSAWRINSIRQSFGSLQKTYELRNQTMQISNGPNRITIKIDPARPEKSLFTLADIPAISVTAQRVWEKKGVKQRIAQPLKDILNDAYAYNLAGRDNMRMDKLAESMVTDEEARQQVLRIADGIYTAQGAQAVPASTAGQRPTPSQTKPSFNLFKLLPWYFWPAIVVVGGLKVFTSGRQRRPRPKSNAGRSKTGDFSMGERTAAKDCSLPVSLEKTVPSVPSAPRHQVANMPSPELSAVSSSPRHQVANGWTPEILSALEWKRFETVCAEYFRLTGYDAKETSFGADGGIDIWVYKPGDGQAFGIVQCKAWNASKVDVDVVRILYAVMGHEKVANGMLITSGMFTRDALAFAEGKPIRMISGESFLAKIMQLSEEKQLALLTIALEGDYWTPTCSRCGIKMVMRQGKSGNKSFFGCVNFPKCKAKIYIKKEELCQW